MGILDAGNFFTGDASKKSPVMGSTSKHVKPKRSRFKIGAKVVGRKLKRTGKNVKEFGQEASAGFFGTGNISKSAVKERKRRAKTRTKVLKKAWHKLW